MSSTMLQLVQQVTGELNLNVPSFVVGNQSQDVQQILALMNAAGYELTKEYDWQALQKEYRFYTQYLNTTGTTTNDGYNITDVTSTGGTVPVSALDSTFSVTGYNVPQDTYVTGVAGTGAVGDVTTFYGVAVEVTGVAGTGSVSGITPTPIKIPTGVLGTGFVNNVVVKIDDNVVVTGVQGTGAVGTVVFGGWTVIDDSQNPAWTVIDDYQDPNWTVIQVA